MSNAPEKSEGLLMPESNVQHVLLKFPDFRRLFIARLISAIGDRFFSIALAWWVVSRDVSHEKFHLGILMAINMLPVVVFGPLLGTFVDRLNKRLCMAVADGVRAVLVSILAMLLWSGHLSLPILYALVFFLSLFSPLFDSAAASSLMHLTDEAYLPRAVATDSLVIEVSGLAGALIGSLLFLTVGVEGAFFFNAFSFLISMIFVLRIRILLPGTSEPGNYLKELGEGMRFLRGKKSLAMLLFAFATLNFFASPLLLIMPILVKDVIRAGADWVAWLQLAFGLGSALTVLGFSFRRSWFQVYPKMCFATLMMGLALAAMSFVTSSFAILVLLFLSGVGVAAVNALALSLFQETVPYELKGRFFALLSTVCFAVMPLTFLVNGYLSEIWPLSTLIFANGMGTVLLSVVIGFLPRLQNEIGVKSECEVVGVV